MPPKDDHLAQALKNERLSGHIRALESDENFADWQVTTLFYSALHLVDAFLGDTLNRHPESHRDRGQFVVKLADLKPIAGQYLNLESRSRDARYGLIPITSTQAKQISQSNFQPIKSRILSLLSGA